LTNERVKEVVSMATNGKKLISCEIDIVIIEGNLNIHH